MEMPWLLKEKKIDISSYIIKFPLEYSIMKGNLGGENHVDLIKITFMRHGKLQKQRSNRKCLYFLWAEMSNNRRGSEKVWINANELGKTGQVLFVQILLAVSVPSRKKEKKKKKNLCIWGDWKDSSVVKSRYCSCRGPELISEHLSQAVYHCL